MFYSRSYWLHLGFEGIVDMSPDYRSAGPDLTPYNSIHVPRQDIYYYKMLHNGNKNTKNMSYIMSEMETPPTSGTGLL